MGTHLHNTIVECLKPEDLEWFAETACVNMLVDELKREELVDLPTIRHLLNHAMHTNTVLVCKIDGKCVGGVVGLLLPNVFNPKFTTLAEIMWYVLPEYRSSRAGLMLLNAFTKKAEEVADEATLSLLNSSEVKRHTLEKRGFELSEFAFRKDCRRI